MIDLNKSLNIFEEYMESDEGKEHTERFLNKIRNKELIEKRHTKILHEKFGDSIDSFIEKVVNKYDSDKYKDRWYKRSIEPPETLYYTLYDYAEFLNCRASNEQIEKYGSGMFGGDVAYILGSYFLQIIHGQGSAVIITKIN